MYKICNLLQPGDAYHSSPVLRVVRLPLRTDEPFSLDSGLIQLVIFFLVRPLSTKESTITHKERESLAAKQRTIPSSKRNCAAEPSASARRVRNRVKLYSTVPAKRTKLRAHGCNIAHLSFVPQPDSLLRDCGKSYGGEFIETIFEKLSCSQLPCQARTREARMHPDVSGFRGVIHVRPETKRVKKD
ncbi:hypothetical protein MTO96_017273 [Rhipicephalus appendiculatus]